MAKKSKETTKKLKEKIIGEHGRFMGKIIMNYDSIEGYYIELYDSGRTCELTSFGPGDKAKSKCKSLFKALSNYCDECYKKSNKDFDLFWNLVDEEFESGWLSADKDGGIYTSMKDIDKFLKFTSKWENRTVINSSQDIESMTQEELTDYLIVSQDKELLAWICNTPVHTFNHMTTESQKEFLFSILKDFNRLSIYFKMNEMFTGLETDMAYFITNVKNEINRSRRITDEAKEQAQYLEFKFKDNDDGMSYMYGLIDKRYTIYGKRLLDKDKHEIETPSSNINKPRRVELTKYFKDKIGFYIQDNPNYFKCYREKDGPYSVSEIVEMPLNF